MRDGTIGLHGGYEADESGAMSPPIHQTVAYSYSSAKEMANVFQGKASGFIYTRIANPTTLALERRLTALERGIGCIATSSGMAALSSVMIGLLRPGDEILSAAGVFGGTASLFQKTLSRFGIISRFRSVASTDEFLKGITDATRVVFIETIGNPRIDVPDIRAIAEGAHQRNIPLVVDSTLTTPSIIRPGEFGADLVIHSTSKYVNGHGTAIGGAIVDTGNYSWANGVFSDIKETAGRAGEMAFLKHLRGLIFRDLGGCPSPNNSFLMLQGLETLRARMAIHCANAELLAARLQDRPEVEWVNHPGMPRSPFYRRVGDQFGGRAGGLFTFGLGTAERAYRFIDSLMLIKNAANLGDAKTMVIHPASTIYSEYSSDDREAMGVTDDMVRISVGIEDDEDLIDDLGQALAKLPRRSDEAISQR